MAGCPSPEGGYLNFAAHECHLCIVGGVIVEIELRAEHSHFELLGSYYERGGFVAGDLEKRLAVHRHDAQPLAERFGKFYIAVGVEPHFRAVRQDYLYAHAARCGDLFVSVFPPLLISVLTAAAIALWKDIGSPAVSSSVFPSSSSDMRCGDGLCCNAT